MPFDARAVANYFIDKATAESMLVDPMKLQKIVYIAHGWHLAITGQPLISDCPRAWAYGPIIPELYDEFKGYGSRPIRTKATYFEPITDEVYDYSLSDSASPAEVRAVKPILDRVWDEYKKYSGLQLSAVTHESGTPWDQVAQTDEGDLHRGLPIPDEIIRRYYLSLARQGRSDGGL